MHPGGQPELHSRQPVPRGVTAPEKRAGAVVSSEQTLLISPRRHLREGNVFDDRSPSILSRALHNRRCGDSPTSRRQCCRPTAKRPRSRCVRQ